jgi:hypothetical protein
MLLSADYDIFLLPSHRDVIGGRNGPGVRKGNKIRHRGYEVGLKTVYLREERIFGGIHI